MAICICWRKDSITPQLQAMAGLTFELDCIFLNKTKIVIFLKLKVYTIVSLRHHLLTGKIAETIDNLKNVLPIGTALKQ